MHDRLHFGLENPEAWIWTLRSDLNAFGVSQIGALSICISCFARRVTLESIG